MDHPFKPNTTLYLDDQPWISTTQRESVSVKSVRLCQYNMASSNGDDRWSEVLRNVKKPLIPARYIIAIISLLSTGFAYATRANLSVAIVSMVPRNSSGEIHQNITIDGKVRVTIIALHDLDQLTLYYSITLPGPSRKKVLFLVHITTAIRQQISSLGDSVSVSTLFI